MIVIIVGFSILVFSVSFRWPRYVVWGIFMILPFQIALNPTRVVDLLAARLLIPVTLLGLLLFLWHKKKRFTISSFLWIALFVATIGSLSFLWANEPREALQRSLVWWSLIPFIVLSEWLFSDERERNILPRMSAILVFFVSIAALTPVVISLLGGRSGIERLFVMAAPWLWGQGFGQAVLAYPSWFVEIGGVPILRSFFPFPDPHMLAFFLAAVLPFVALRSSVFSRFSLSLGFVALLATFSRGSYLGVVVASGVTIALLWSHVSFLRRKIIVGGLSFLLLVLIVPNPFGDRFLSSFDFSEGSVAGRTETMREAIGVIRYHPWSGVGLGNYARVVVPLSLSGSPIYAHSSYLDIATEVGLPVLVVIVGALAVLVFRSGRAVLAQSHDTMHVAAFFALIWFLVHALFETPIYSPRVLPYFFIIIVLLSRSLYESSSSSLV